MTSQRVVPLWPGSLVVSLQSPIWYYLALIKLSSIPSLSPPLPSSCPPFLCSWPGLEHQTGCLSQNLFCFQIHTEALQQPTPVFSFLSVFSTTITSLILYSSLSPFPPILSPLPFCWSPSVSHSLPQSIINFNLRAGLNGTIRERSMLLIWMPARLDLGTPHRRKGGEEKSKHSFHHRNITYTRASSYKSLIKDLNPRDRKYLHTFRLRQSHRWCVPGWINVVLILYGNLYRDQIWLAIQWKGTAGVCVPSFPEFSVFLPLSIFFLKIILTAWHKFELGSIIRKYPRGEREKSLVRFRSGAGSCESWNEGRGGKRATFPVKRWVRGEARKGMCNHHLHQGRIKLEGSVSTTFLQFYPTRCSSPLPPSSGLASNQLFR